jgi:hypothetical protein
MKTRVRIAVLVLTSICAAVGQTPSVVDGFSLRPGGPPHPKYSNEEFRLLTIKRLMERPSPLQVGNAQLYRLGDQAAVDIMKILGGKSVSDAQIPTILDMLRKAYEVPKAILIAADRQPKASLFLLGALEGHTEDWSLKQRISEMRQNLQTVASNSGAVAP